jgi:hypothetical protein
VASKHSDKKSKTSTDAQPAAASDAASAEKKPRRAKRAEAVDGSLEKPVRKRKGRAQESTGKLVRAGEQSTDQPEAPISEPAAKPEAERPSTQTEDAQPVAVEPVTGAAPAVETGAAQQSLEDWSAPAPAPAVVADAVPQRAPNATEPFSSPRISEVQAAMPRAPVVEPPEQPVPTAKSRVDIAVATLRSAPLRAADQAAVSFPSMQDLPFPTVRFAVAWGEAADASHRVHAAVGAMTVTLQILAASQLGFLSKGRYRNAIDAGAFLAAGGYLDAPLAPAAWSRLAFGLAALSARSAEGTIPNLAQALADAGGLAEEIEHALVALHAPSLPDEQLALSRQGEIVDLLRTLAAVCKPLRNIKLLSVESRKATRGDDRIEYSAFRFDGVSAEPEQTSVWVGRALAPGWCYLFDGPSLEASLAPIVFASRCVACGRFEIGVAGQIAVGGPGAAVAGRTLHCDQGFTVPTCPWPLARAASIWVG